MLNDDASGRPNREGRMRPWPGGGSLDLTLLDDEALVEHIVQRDPRALEAVYVKYSRPIFSLALKILGDREVVEEVVQEVFLRLWIRAEGFDSRRGKLLSWLLTITHHRAVD